MSESERERKGEDQDVNHGEVCDMKLMVGKVSLMCAGRIQMVEGNDGENIEEILREVKRERILGDVRENI